MFRFSVELITMTPVAIFMIIIGAVTSHPLLSFGEGSASGAASGQRSRDYDADVSIKFSGNEIFKTLLIR